MKALSLWQPWASLMACAAKHYETRGRLTHYRGDLAICAARHVETELDALKPYYGALVRQERIARLHYLPVGVVLCVVNVIDCVSTNTISGGNIGNGKWNLDDLEYVCGNYGPDRFAWITNNCRRLKTPVPVIGHQGFFNLPADVETQILAQL